MNKNIFQINKKNSVGRFAKNRNIMFNDIKLSLTFIDFKSGICFCLIYKDGIVNLNIIISNDFGNIYKVIIENITYLILFCN